MQLKRFLFSINAALFDSDSQLETHSNIFSNQSLYLHGSDDQDTDGLSYHANVSYSCVLFTLTIKFDIFLFFFNANGLVRQSILSKMDLP